MATTANSSTTTTTMTAANAIKLERATKERRTSNSRANTITTGSDNDTLFDRKIEVASEGLTSRYFTSFYKIPLKENALTLASYIISLKSEINPSNNYRIDIIEKISRLSTYHSKTLFKDMTREQILNFLDSLRKPETSDPLHKWIGYSDNKVMGTEFTFTKPSEIEPGQKAPFEVTVGTDKVKGGYFESQSMS